MIRKPVLLAAACLGMALLAGQGWPEPGAMAAGGSPSSQPGVAGQWSSVNGDSDETGFSHLKQITAGNAGKLGLSWFLDLPGEASLEASPIEVGGTLYFTGSYATVYAVDAVSGKLLWSHAPNTWQHNPVKMNFGFGANRGVAYANGKIFSAALDSRLIAMDARTGKVLWETETTDPHSGQTITGAPRVFNGKIIIGQGGADFGARGFVSAYDQNTGKQVWKFYVAPGSPEENKGDPVMERAAATWGGKFWKSTGGGPWDSMTFDKELNRVYIGTANASPYDADARSPGGGDNLFTASIVALDADTGKYVWHYQINPRDSWDYDCTQQITLATLNIGGKPRQVLMQAPKNGFFYVIDRQTGKVISAEKLGKANWADHIDLKTGRPVENANIRYETGQSTIYPCSSGAHSWMRMAYNPGTGLVYVPYMQMATRFRRGATEDGELNVGGLNIGESHLEPGDGKGTLIAWDPVAQKARWRAPIDTLWNGGAVTTAGNLVFQGAADGWFSAYDATTGARLWRFYAGMGIIGSPMTYQVGGKQYVSILAGYGGSAAVLSDIMNVGWKYAGPRRLLTFALDGKQALPPSDPPTLKINALDNPDEHLDPQQVAMGSSMFLACAACHGRGVVGAGGPAPDLRESPIPLDADAFYAVVHDGAKLPQGMPQFAIFGKPQIEAIRQYIRSRARLALAKN